MKRDINNKGLIIGLVISAIVCFSLAIIFNFNSNDKKDKDSLVNIDTFNLDDKYYGDGKLVLITASAFDTYKEESYILYVSGISNKLAYSCDEVFGNFTKNNKIDFLSITSEEFNKIDLSKDIKSIPTVIIVKKGKVVAYLDIDKKGDLNKYQDETKLKNWLSKYVNLEKK